MAGTIPKIIGKEQIDEENWKSLFRNEPSAFEMINTGIIKKSDGLIYMIGCRDGNGNCVPIVDGNKEFFNIENGGFVLLSEKLSDSMEQGPKVVSRNELPFDLENPGENTLQEVYLNANFDVGYIIDFLSVYIAESESFQVYYFNEESKQAIIASVERYKGKLQEWVDYENTPRSKV